MTRMQLSIEEMGEVRDSKAFINEEPILYSVVGLAPEIELTIYRKMGRWWITGSRPGQGPYWPGGYESIDDALAAISNFFSSPKCRAAMND